MPHATLESFWRIANDVVGSRELIGASAAALDEWGTVTVGAIVSAGLLKDEWLDDESVVEVLGGDANALRGQLMEDVFAAEQVTAIQSAWALNRGNAALRSLSRALPGLPAAWDYARAGAPETDDDPDLGMIINLVAPFYEWMPGNLVVGPEGSVRLSDPGDRFDAEAAAALGEGHRAVVDAMLMHMEAAIAGGDAQEEHIRGALRCIRTLGEEYRTKTEPSVQAPGDEVAPDAPYWHLAEGGWVLEPAG